MAIYRFLTFTTQQAKGVRKSDPETMGGFTGVEFSPGEMHTQTVTNRGTKKRPFPHTLPTVGGSEKVTLGQLNPQRPARKDIVIYRKHRANVQVTKRDEDEFAGHAFTNGCCERQPNQKPFAILKPENLVTREPPEIRSSFSSKILRWRP